MSVILEKMTVMLMLSAPILMEATCVIVMKDILVMEHFALVSA